MVKLGPWMKLRPRVYDVFTASLVHRVFSGVSLRSHGALVFLARPALVVMLLAWWMATPALACDCQTVDAADPAAHVYLGVTIVMLTATLGGIAAIGRWVWGLSQLE
jgi:hypothetical protein